MRSKLITRNVCTTRRVTHNLPHKEPSQNDCTERRFVSVRGQAFPDVVFGDIRATSVEVVMAVQAALRLTLFSAMAVNFLSAAFSSSRFCCSKVAQSLRPSSFAQAIKLP